MAQIIVITEVSNVYKFTFTLNRSLAIETSWVHLVKMLFKVKGYFLMKNRFGIAIPFYKEFSLQMWRITLKEPNLNTS